MARISWLLPSYPSLPLHFLPLFFSCATLCHSSPLAASPHLSLSIYLSLALSRADSCDISISNGHCSLLSFSHFFHSFPPVSLSPPPVLPSRSHTHSYTHTATHTHPHTRTWHLSFAASLSFPFLSLSFLLRPCPTSFFLSLSLSYSLLSHTHSLTSHTAALSALHCVLSRGHCALLLVLGSDAKLSHTLPRSAPFLSRPLSPVHPLSPSPSLPLLPPFFIPLYLCALPQRRSAG